MGSMFPLNSECQNIHYFFLGSYIDEFKLRLLFETKKNKTKEETACKKERKEENARKKERVHMLSLFSPLCVCMKKVVN